MTIYTETRHTAEFIKSEANMDRSRETVQVRAGAEALVAGTILGLETSGGNYVRHDSDNSDGSEDEAAILIEGIDANTTADRAVIIRDAEVVGDELTYEDGADAAAKTASNTALAALGIIVR